MNILYIFINGHFVNGLVRQARGKMYQIKSKACLPTLLCTSQGLVMADKSQPVIIMALEVYDMQTVREDKAAARRNMLLF